MQNPVVRESFIQHPPFALGLDEQDEELFVRFIPHNQGEGFRAIHVHRTVWLMLIGVPLDYCNTRCLSEMIGTFGQFLDWEHTDRRLVRSLVRVSFPENALVPRDILFREFAPWGGSVVSWTAPVYILTTGFADAALPVDEDLMPINGNPHPMPGDPIPAAPVWALPPYPALGWNEVPVRHHDNQGNFDNNEVQNEAADAGWPMWQEEQVAQNDPIQVEQPPQD